MNHMNFPYQVGPNGRTTLAGDEAHIRNLIQQVLFTTPGERVNRPAFGSGLLQLIFAGMDDELAHTTQALVQGALQQWLGDLIQVEAVQVESLDACISVTVQYVIRRSQRRETTRFTRPV